MKFWALESDPSITVVIKSRITVEAIVRQGINSTAIREVLKTFEPSEFSLSLYDAVNQSFLESYSDAVDIISWSWVPIFSARAVELIMTFGGMEDDFIKCNIQGLSGQDFFLYLPKCSLNIVDFDKSAFLAWIPGEAPIPFRLEKLVTIGDPELLPHLLRAKSVNNEDLVELLISNEFKLSWESSGLINAIFRDLR